MICGNLFLHLLGSGLFGIGVASFDVKVFYWLGCAWSVFDVLSDGLSVGDGY